MTFRLMASALRLVERGWFVFPLRPQDKRPLPGFTRWEQRATTNPSQIERWWAVSPYNVGIATGPSDLLVIDCDVATDHTAAHGVAALVALAEQAGESLPETFAVTTPSGGVHYYFRPPKQTPLGNTAGKLAPKIDTRGIGGYVVGFGSQTTRGYYSISVDVPVKELPAWLAARLLPPSAPREPREIATELADRYLAAILHGEAERVATAPVGTRNNALNSAAFILGQLVGGGDIAEGEVRDLLRNAAAGHIGVSKFSVAELERTIASGLTAGQRYPRQVKRR